MEMGAWEGTASQPGSGTSGWEHRGIITQTGKPGAEPDVGGKSVHFWIF